MEETTTRPYNQVLLDLYSGGEALGFGIGHSALKSEKMGNLGKSQAKVNVSLKFLLNGAFHKEPAE